MAKLAEQFVCVRMQSMNGVNIGLFQFERDLTWMAFFMNGQDQFYARYGGRDDSGPESHLTRDSLLRTMREVLKLHEKGLVQTSRYEPKATPTRTPEQIPPMNAMIARRKDSKCIHCHDVKVAELRHLQSLDRFAREMVYTYPTPAAVGIGVDRDTQSTVRSVAPGSPAERAGVRAGDKLVSADGQRITTLADFARVLELTPKQARLPLELRRNERPVAATLELSGDWRRSEDPSWRESLHVAGPNAGFWGQKLNGEERRRQGIADDAMAVRVTFVWADHTRRSGVKVGDIVVGLDGLKRDAHIQHLHAHLNLNRNYGDVVPIVVRRDGKDHELSLKLPESAPND